MRGTEPVKVPLDADIYEVRTLMDSKVIYRVGYFYDGNMDEEEWMRFDWVEGHLPIPFTQKDYQDTEENASCISDLTPKEAEELYQDTFKDARPLPMKSVTQDTPEGLYIDDCSAYRDC